MLEKIGGCGRAQIKIVFLVQSVHYFVLFHVLSPIFIGVEPKWTCGSSEEDQDACLRFRQGKCAPKYSNDFTSIVSEVLTLVYSSLAYGPKCN